MIAMRVDTRVRVLSWYDHAALIGVRRHGAEVVGTVVRIDEVASGLILSVRVDGVDGIFIFSRGDIELLAGAS
jgi:hypothetical protein